MLRARTRRSFVCLLLAVATAGGTVAVPVRACACTARRAAPAASPVPVAVVEPAAPKCGHCCPPTATSCCCAPTPEPAAPAGCDCARCDCDQPARLPEAPPPTGGPTSDTFAQFDDAAAPLPLFALPPRGERAGRVTLTSSPAPADLVLTLSRRTC